MDVIIKELNKQNSIKIAKIILKHAKINKILDKLFRFINTAGYSPLHTACQKNNYDMIVLFLKYGADMIYTGDIEALPFDLLNEKTKHKLKNMYSQI